MEDEIWKYIDEFTGFYKISNHGRIKSVNRTIRTGDNFKRNYAGIILKNTINNTGYYRVTISVFGRYYYRLVHRLLAIAFLPNPDKKQFINHIDGNKLNNDLSNLEWCTHLENMRHAYSTGLAKAPKLYKGEKSIAAKLNNEQVIQIKHMLKNGYNVDEIAKNYPVNGNCIRHIKNGSTWSHIKI